MFQQTFFCITVVMQMKKQQGPKQLAEALLVGLGLALGRVSLGHAEDNNLGAPDSQPVVF